MHTKKKKFKQNPYCSRNKKGSHSYSRNLHVKSGSFIQRQLLFIASDLDSTDVFELEEIGASAAHVIQILITPIKISSFMFPRVLALQHPKIVDFFVVVDAFVVLAILIEDEPNRPLRFAASRRSVLAQA